MRPSEWMGAWMLMIGLGLSMTMQFVAHSATATPISIALIDRFVQSCDPL